ncbi:MAG TPA: serine hydrolase [Anaerolineales bacterium]|nr:serine hydrolase [Anaerolineales bacterium]
MKVKHISILKRILLAITVIMLVVAGAAAWMVTPGLREPAAVPAPDYWPTDGWRTNTPEQQGFDSEELTEALNSIQEEGTNIDSLLIVHNGYLVLDAHFAPYDGTLPHNQASVTKSLMTTLIGIAVDQDKIDLDQPMVSFFPDRTIANLDERKASISVQHLVTMRNGMDSGCESDDLGTIERMRIHPDWVQAALDRPMVAEPGTEFCYDSPGMHILSAILQEATGMTAMDFAQQNLFGPLGIQDAIWDVDPQGYNRGWGDVHLTPESAAKIGYLWLHQGDWNGQQIISRDWVVNSVRRYSTRVGHDSGYGYGWWINNSHYFAAGRGGQTIRVIPALNMVLVTTGGGFDIPEIEDYLWPLLVRSNRSLPANPEGQAVLQETLTRIQQTGAVPTGVSTPKIAKLVSGKTYQCEKNPLGLESVRFDFNDPNVAVLYHRPYGQDLVWEIGLDGRYRQLSPSGEALIGFWEDAETFHMESFDIGTQVYLAKFQEHTIQVAVQGADLTIACTVLSR